MIYLNQYVIIIKYKKETKGNFNAIEVEGYLNLKLNILKKMLEVLLK